MLISQEKMLKQSTLDFLTELRSNNNKVWFDTNRPRYETAKADVLQLAESVIAGLSGLDADLMPLQAKDCIFRINRDIRFTADKSPYKTSMGFWMNRGGKKASTAGYYVHIEPGEKSFVAAGIHAPDAEVLKRVRTEILYDFESFRGIISEAKFSSFFSTVELEGHKTARVPVGFDPSHPSAEYLKLKSYVGTFSIADQVLCNKDASGVITEAFAAAVPFVQFLNLSFFNDQN